MLSADNTADRVVRLLSADNTTPDALVLLLIDRIDAVDREVGLPFGWFFLMTHGHWVDPDVGLAIAKGLKAQRVRLPDRDAAVLLRWAGSNLRFLRRSPNPPLRSGERRQFSMERRRVSSVGLTGHGEP